MKFSKMIWKIVAVGLAFATAVTLMAIFWTNIADCFTKAVSKLRSCCVTVDEYSDFADV